MDRTSALIAKFHEVLDEAGDIAFGCLPPDEATAWLCKLPAIRARLDAVICTSFTAAGVAAIDESGHRSVADRVAAQTGVDPRSLRADAGLGVWLLDYPELATAFATGRLTKEHVRVIRARENQRTRPHLGEAQGYLIEAAWSCQWTEFLAVLRYWELAADPDGAEPVDQQESRGLNYNRRADGTVSGRFTLDPVAGQGVLGVVERHYQRLFRADAASGSMRTATQRRADAFVDVVTGAATGSAPDPLVHVVVSEAVVADHFARLADPARRTDPLPLDYDDEVDGRCEFIDGTPVHPSWALATMATAAFRRLVFDPEAEITDLGRQARCFPPQLKQALLIKARGRCQHPGCDAPVAWLQADHVVPWSREGPTSLTNGQILCDPHNKLKRDRPG